MTELNILGLNKLIEILPKTILGIELWGSCIVPGINNPEDVDLSIFCSTAQEKKEILILLASKTAFSQNLALLRYFRVTYNLCIQVKFAPPYIDRLEHGIYMYQVLFRQPVLNFKLTPLNVDSNKHLKLLPESVRQFRHNMSRRKQEAPSVNKWWYHLYMEKLCFGENKRTFSEKELYNINLLHDCIFGEERDKLIKECLDWVDTL